MRLPQQRHYACRGTHLSVCLISACFSWLPRQRYYVCRSSDLTASWNTVLCRGRAYWLPRRWASVFARRYKPSFPCRGDKHNFFCRPSISTFFIPLEISFNYLQLLRINSFQICNLTWSKLGLKLQYLRFQVHFSPCDFSFVPNFPIFSPSFFFALFLYSKPC